MFDKAGLKLLLDRAIFQKIYFTSKKETPKKEEENAISEINKDMKKVDAIQLLVRKGAYGVLMDTDDASQKFCEEDIDQILRRRTKVIKHSDN
jgi:chromodomain-helicase-DNA-binding protein 7